MGFLSIGHELMVSSRARPPVIGSARGRHRGCRQDQPRQAKADAEALAGIARGQWGIESVHWVRDTAYDEDANTGYAGNGPQVMATLRNLAVSLLYLVGVKEVTRTLQAIARDRTRMLDYLPL